MTTRRIAATAAGSIAALVCLAAAEVATPASLTWSGLERWYDDAGPGPVAVALVRAGGLAAAAWMLGACCLQLLARAARRRAVTRLAHRLSPRFLRAVATGTSALSLSAGLAVPTSAPGGDPPGTAVMVPLDPPAASTTTTTTLPPVPAPAGPPPPTTRGRVPGAGAGETVVERGDSFWSIAVEERGDRDLVAYWLALIDENRGRLVDPGNPDLLYPGQVLRLP